MDPEVLELRKRSQREGAALSEGTLGIPNGPDLRFDDFLLPEHILKREGSCSARSNARSPAVKLLAGSEPHCSVVKFEEVFKW